MEFKEHFDTFFKNSRNLMNKDKIIICMGNEACDVDSFISSLVISMHEKCMHVVNMSKNIFMAKGDIQFICKKFEINIDDLIFLEKPIGNFSLKAKKLGTKLCLYKDIEIINSIKIIDKNIELILVDHHEPIIELEDLKINLIIDHHQLSISSLKAKRIYMDQEIGSCSTLVSKYIGHSLTTKKNNINEEFESEFYCKHIAKLLLIPIILDTSLFRRRTSHFDKGEYEKLLKISNETLSNLKEIRKELLKDRKNDSKLSNNLILLKDFKKYHFEGLNWGCSTVKYSFKKWVDRESKSKNAGHNLELIFNNFRKDQDLDFLFINRKNGKKRFFIMINCLFEKKMAKENNFKLKNYKGLDYYKIDVKMSRKISMPLVHDFIIKLLNKKTNKNFEFEELKQELNKK